MSFKHKTRQIPYQPLLQGYFKVNFWYFWELILWEVIWKFNLVTFGSYVCSKKDVYHFKVNFWYFLGKEWNWYFIVNLWLFWELILWEVIWNFKLVTFWSYVCSKKDVYIISKYWLILYFWDSELQIRYLTWKSEVKFVINSGV